MPRYEITVTCPAYRSFRVDQMAGIFDLPPTEHCREQFAVEVPGPEEPWQIGLIVGPSGSGKSTVAKRAFGETLVGGYDWPPDKAVLDGFPESLSVQEISQALSSVGFSSPPSWLKPYHVLSNGERFRCDLARALLIDRPLVAYDEFTSVVDRTVAKIGSAAVSKAIRRGRIKRRFVAVTCHYDVAEWLEPDWVLDMASMRLARGRLRRPTIRLDVALCDRSAWQLFRRHHYLSGNLHRSAYPFVAFWDGQPVAFSAWIGSPSRNAAPYRREHRVVVLPDYQGLGIGTRLSEFCASLWKALGYRPTIVSSHPAVIRGRSANPRWKRTRLGMVSPYGRTGIWGRLHRKTGHKTAISCDRLTASFEYIGPALDLDTARRIMGSRPASVPLQEATDAIRALIERYPGATAGFLRRRTGYPAGTVQGAVTRLLRAGKIRQAGWGRGGDPRAYYRAGGHSTRLTPVPPLSDIAVD